ncbi:MAG: hypothetical protein FOGNACKC_02885 [Anaerolineae bacterium]|nr:hypothetical protein [Anaerolineae bacterium]
MTEIGLVNEFLEIVKRELNTDYHSSDDHLSELTVYMMDLSPLRLRLSTFTPFILVTAGDIQCFGEETVADLVRQELVIRQDVPGSAVVLVEQDSGFLHSLGQDPYWAVILDRDVMTRIMRHPNPKREFLDSLRSKIPLRFLSPYEPNQPVTGSQFYGRTSELNLILTHPKRSFAIEGGRRIGKTSLLLEVKRLLINKVLPKGQAKRVVSYDFWGYKGEDSFFGEVVRHFDEGFPKLVKSDFANYFPRFVLRMKRMYGGAIIFLFDEVDDLIVHEQKTNYLLLDLLKRVAQADNCRLLVAGFRDLSEELNRHDTSLSFCQRLPLHNLEREQTMAMLREPMFNMGVKFERDVYPQILGDTGGHPQLVQLYGQALIEILDATGERIVTLAHIRQIKRTGRLYDTLIETLIDNTNDLEFALVYSLADQDEFGLEEIEEILASREIQLELKQIHHICRKLESIGIISRRGQADTYYFSIPLQPALARKLAGDDFVWRKARQQMQLEDVGL